MPMAILRDVLSKAGFNEVKTKEAHTIALEKKEFSMVNNCIYFYSSTGYGRTKFNMNSFEKK